ncbi:MAG: hypothetical protein F6J90_35770 [Moorea sp. SIOASIH]|uniref:hypothetical protein n=1 Tax=Moorena sp. SIOASIH TaxID=2607817 RepID=UPI0013BBE755|nr:hypothetical protein [Moorena sp. SIOASIH]NEO41398.1 hypothetical protein [Moorena sp. SIOASIH]
MLLNSLKKQLMTLSWWKWIVIIDILFIVATFLSAINSPWLNTLFKVYHFNLAGEMNIAVWWSSILLFIAAFLSYENFVSEKRRGYSTSWLIISSVMLLLSLDEIGSIHEVLQEDSWSNYIPFALVGIILLTYSLLKLFSQQNTRKSVILILSGFILFGSVVFQEYIEVTTEWSDSLLGIRAAIEEGSELLGTLLCLFGITIQSQKHNDSDSLISWLPNPLLMKDLPIFLLGGMVIHIAASFLVQHLPSFLNPIVPSLSNGGIPAIWYPMTIFFMLFCASSRKALNLGNNNPQAWLLLSVSFLIFSAVICDRAVFGSGESFAIFYLLHICKFLIIAFFYFNFYPGKCIKYTIILYIIPLILLFGLFFDGLVVPFLISGLFTYFIAQIFLNKPSRQTVN